MMTSDHIQSAVSALEDSGAETIVVIPTTTADHSTLTRQWDYIFGKRDDSAYLDVPRVETKARVRWTPTPTADPIVAEIMLDYANEMSRDPANEVVVILGHGPQSAEDNAKELEILARHAEYIKSEGGYHDVLFGNVQDDAPEGGAGGQRSDRSGHRAQDAIDGGYRVVAVHTALTYSGIVKRLEKDISDLADFNNKGLMMHPRFGDWLDGAISREPGRMSFWMVSGRRRARRPVGIDRKRPFLGIERQVTNDLVRVGRQRLSELQQVFVSGTGEKDPEKLQYDNRADDDSRDARTKKRRRA